MSVPAAPNSHGFIPRSQVKSSIEVDGVLSLGRAPIKRDVSQVDPMTAATSVPMQLYSARGVGDLVLASGVNNLTNDQVYHYQIEMDSAAGVATVNLPLKGVYSGETHRFIYATGGNNITFNYVNPAEATVPVTFDTVDQSIVIQFLEDNGLSGWRVVSSYLD